MSDPRPIAIVPARLGSSRLSRKPLADIAGAPLIVRVCDNLRGTELFARVVVATDAEEIAAVVARAHYEYAMTPAQLPSGTDRVARACTQLGLGMDQVVVNVQGDEPFVSRGCLAALLAKIGQGDNHVVTPVEAIDAAQNIADPDLVKAVIGVAGQALYFSRVAVPYLRDTADRSQLVHYRHVGVYAYTTGTLGRLTQLPVHRLEQIERLEQLRWLAHGERIICVPVEPSARGVDTEEDRLRADAYYRRYVSQSPSR